MQPNDRSLSIMADVGVPSKKVTLTSGRAIRGTILHIVLAIGSILMVAPFIWMALSGLKSSSDIFRVPPTLLCY